MNNLAELQQRRAQLKVKIEQQRIDLKKTFLEAKQEIEPAFLLKKAVRGLFDDSNRTSISDTPGILGKLSSSLPFIFDLFIKNRTLAMLLKMIAPIALKYLPALVSGNTPEETGEKSAKAKLYSSARKGIASLRTKLKKTEQEPESPLEPTEN